MNARAWIASAVALLLSACSSPNQRTIIFQCVAKLDGCQRSQEAAELCRLVAARTTQDPGRGCNALRWSIPRAYRPELTTRSVRGDTLRFDTGFPGLMSADKGFLKLDPLPNRTHGEAIKLFTTIWHAGPAREGPAGYTAYAGHTENVHRVLLVSELGPEYYLECGAKPEAPTIPQGFCGVSTRYLDVMHFEYSIPGRDFASAPVLNRRIAAKLDGFRGK